MRSGIRYELSSASVLYGLAHGLFYPAFNALAIEGAGAHERGKVMAIFNGAFNVVVNEFLAPHNGGDEKIVTSGKITLTNPLTGDTAIQRFAGPVWNTFVSGDPDGVHVEQSTVKGLPEMWKLEHGRRLIRDAGYVVIQTTFDGEEFVSQEVLVDKGPHPDLESDFELFCETLVPALGIS